MAIIVSPIATKHFLTPNNLLSPEFSLILSENQAYVYAYHGKLFIFKMKKLFFIGTLISQFLLVPLVGFADDQILPNPADKAYKSLVLNLNDERQVIVPLSTSLATTYDGANLVFVNGDMRIEIPASEVAKWFYSSQLITTGLNDIDNETAPSVESVGEKSVRLSGLKENATISIFDMAGRTVKTAVASESAVISLESLTAGVYVIDIDGKHRLKISIR